MAEIPIKVGGVVIVCAPQGSGKSEAAEALRQLFGCSHVVHEWDGKSELREGALALTNVPWDVVRGNAAANNQAAA